MESIALTLVQYKKIPDHGNFADSLRQAHSHARNALIETRKTNPTAASEEHELAAGEFANAAKSTGNAEARINSTPHPTS